MALYIGLMSGTSLDAVDGVLADCSDTDAQACPKLRAFESLPIPTELRAALLHLQQPGPDELTRAAAASLELTALYAAVAQRLLQQAAPRAVAAIGAHGQTVRHRPDLGYSLQLLHGAHLAEATGCRVVTDFRNADLAAGGQGAPLVPAFHALALGGAGQRQAIINIGGMANVTLLTPEPQGVLGYDVGPGNVLLDSWCLHHTQRAYDAEGAWAASGRLHAPLLAQLRAEPYLAAPPPKSTGRELFNDAWLAAHLSHHPSLPPADVQRTLTELTASTLADACRALAVDHVTVCGGGAHNRYLMTRLAALLAPTPVQSSAARGIAPCAVEALAFAWLAHARMLEYPGNLPAATGARGPRVLGALYPAPV